MVFLFNQLEHHLDRHEFDLIPEGFLGNYDIEEANSNVDQQFEDNQSHKKLADV